jgi:hypothetical protein
MPPIAHMEGPLQVRSDPRPMASASGGLRLSPFPL